MRLLQNAILPVAGAVSGALWGWEGLGAFFLGAFGAIVLYFLRELD